MASQSYFVCCPLLAGGDIAIVNSMVNTLPYFVFGKAEIKSPEDLADFALRLALKGVGLSLKDIKGVTVGGAPARVTAVATGQLDLTVGTEGEKIRGDKLGLKVVIDMAKLNIPFQFTCTVATWRTIRENPDMVRRMVRAMAEAVHFYKNNKILLLCALAGENLEPLTHAHFARLISRRNPLSSISRTNRLSI